MSLDDYRKEFECSANRSLSMPLAGAIIWAVIAVVATQLSEPTSTLILLFASGAIFPVALLIARFRGENLVSLSNPLAKLIGLSILMVNLLWAVHIPLFLYSPTFVPLSLGVGLGLHWIVYSWIVQHPVGIIHAILRTVLILLAWLAFPESRLLAVSVVVVFVYAVSIYQMTTRPIAYT